MKLTAVLLFTLLCCGLIPQGVYAAENEKEVVRQQDKSKNKNAGVDSDNANKEIEAVQPTTLTLTMQDEAGVPISGVSLSAIEADFSGKVRDSATTDKNGKAVFTHLKSGTYYFFANFNAIRRHSGYGMPVLVTTFKTSRTFFISENRKIDLSTNAEITFTVNKDAFIMFQTYLQVVRSGKIVLMNNEMGIQQIIPVASTDFMQIYLPMRKLYQIVTIKNDDFDAWILEFYAHNRLRIELL